MDRSACSSPRATLGRDWTRRASTICSTPSIRPSRRASAWDSRSAARSSRPTAGGSGRRPTMAGGNIPVCPAGRSGEVVMTTSDAVVFVVDDDAAMRRSLENLLRSVGLRVAAFASTQDFLSSKRPASPACLVLDVRLPGASGLELQKGMAGTEHEIPIIFITGHGDIPMSVQAMKAGAVGFLTKPFRDQDMLDAVAAALERDRKRRKDERQMSDLSRRYASLTPRERDVLAWIVAGLLNKQIAAELGTSEATVKEQRGHVMAKMQAGSVAELVRFASRLGITPAGGASNPPKAG